MKKRYTSPDVRRELFETADIITVSPRKMMFTIFVTDPADVEKLDADELFPENA